MESTRSKISSTNDGLTASRPLEGPSPRPDVRLAAADSPVSTERTDEFLSISHRPGRSLATRQERARLKLEEALNSGRTLKPKEQLELLEENSPSHSKAEIARLMALRDKKGNSIFHHAVNQYDYVALNKLFEHEGASEHVSAPNLRGETPYSLAEKKGKAGAPMAELLARFRGHEVPERAPSKPWWKFWK